MIGTLRRLAVVVLLGIAPPMAPRAFASVVPFDDVPVVGNWFLGLPGTHYATLGARFSFVNLATGEVQDSLWLVRGGQLGHGSVSGPNGAAIWGGESLRIRVDFVDPATGSPATVSFVSAMVGDFSTEPDLITMDAYDGAGRHLGRSRFASPTGGGFGLVSVSAPGIRRVEFDEPASGADLDDLTFDTPSTVDAGSVAPRPELALAPPAPQPWSSGTLRLRFALRNDSPAQIELLDVAGRRRYSRAVGDLGAGWHALEIRADDRPEPGLYFLRLHAGREVRSTRLVVGR